MGSILAGYVGDKFGRKKAMFLGLAMVIPSVFVGGFVPNFYVYTLVVLIACSASPIIWICGHNYCMEYFSPRNRKIFFCLAGNYNK